MTGEILEILNLTPDALGTEEVVEVKTTPASPSPALKAADLHDRVHSQLSLQENKEEVLQENHEYENNTNITNTLTSPDVEWDKMKEGNCRYKRLQSDCIVGICRIEGKGGSLDVHKHAPAENYLIMKGKAWVTVGEKQILAQPGTTIYIPSNVKHGVSNPFDEEFVFYYVFPTCDTAASISYSYQGTGRSEVVTSPIARQSSI